MRTSVSLPDRSVTCCDNTYKYKCKLPLFTHFSRSFAQTNESDGNGFGGIATSYDEGVVEGGEDVGNAEDILPLADGGAERHVLLLGLPRLPPPGLHSTGDNNKHTTDLKEDREGEMAQIHTMTAAAVAGEEND